MIRYRAFLQSWTLWAVLVGGLTLIGGSYFVWWFQFSQSGFLGLIGNGSADALAISPDGSRIASCYSDAVHVWDVQTKQKIRSLKISNLGRHQVEFTPDGKLLACTDDEGVSIWNAETGDKVESFNIPRSDPLAWDNVKGIVALAFHPSGKSLACAGGNMVIYHWDLNNKELLEVFSGHTDAVTSISFSPEGKYLASTGADKTVRLWNVANGEIIGELQGHEKVINQIVFHPTLAVLASASHDNTVKIWDLNTLTVIQTLEHHRWVQALLFSVDGTTLVSGCAGNAYAEIWDWKNARKLTSFQPPEFQGNMMPLCRSRDGELLICGMFNGVQVWKFKEFRAKAPTTSSFTNLVADADKTLAKWTDPALGKKLPEPEITWQNFRSASDSFSVKFPGQPGPTKGTTTNIYFVEFQGSLFTVACHDWSAFGDSGVQAYLKGYINGSRRAFVKVEEEKQFSSDNLLITEFKAKRPKGQWTRVQFFSYAGRIYDISWKGPRDGSQAKAIDTFFASFKIEK